MIPFGPHLDGYHDVADQFIHAQRLRAQRQLAALGDRKARIRTRAAFEAYRKEVRDHYLQGIGGLPVPDGAPRPPLRPRITGVLDRGAFRIEKLLYESLPGVHVTALVYVPRVVPAPGPAVLFVCGHHETAKQAPEYQAICVDLVMNGFVVLAMDPPGQGERKIYWDPSSRRSRIGGSTTEHTHAGIPILLQGASPSRFFTWDAIRAMDYLTTRREVDPRRIGITGNSGGGTQTVLMMLAEPRLAAAVPCTFVMTLESYQATGQPQDAEQLIPGAMLHGPDHDDYLTMLAPRPVLVGAAAYDFFPIEGTLEAVERARRVYRLYGAEDRVQVAVAPTRHEYGSVLRQAAVNWFRRHLAGLPPDFETGRPDPLALESLNVTRSGQVVADFPETRTLFHLGRDMAAEARPTPPRDAAALRKVAAQALAIEDRRRDTPIHARIITDTTVDEAGGRCRVEKIFYFSEPEICSAGVMIHPPAAARGTILLLLENGTASMAGERERVVGLLRSGRRVFVFDPRGVGALEQRPWSGGFPHDREYRLGCDAMMMGHSTLGLRVWDVLRARDYLRTRDDVRGGPLEIYGVDSGAVWAWLAAALEPDFTAVTVDRLLAAYRLLPAAAGYDSRRWNFRTMAYGLLRHFDLPDLLPALAPRAIRVITALNAEGQPLPRGEYGSQYVAEQTARGGLPAGWGVAEGPEPATR